MFPLPRTLFDIRDEYSCPSMMIFPVTASHQAALEKPIKTKQLKTLFFVFIEITLYIIFYDY
jgi:hypothetical protein